jgi:hypothetical protein
MKVLMVRQNKAEIVEQRELTPAKAQSTLSSEERDELFWKIWNNYSPIFSELCGLGVFA